MTITQDKTAQALTLMNDQRVADNEERSKAEPQEPASQPFYYCLGRDGKTFYYYSIPYKCICALLPREHTMSEFETIAPKEDWIALLESRDSIPKNMLASSIRSRLMKETGKMRFKPELCRCHGLWREGEEFIYFTGEQCYLVPQNGEPLKPVDDVRPNACIYAGDSKSITVPAAEPMSDQEAANVLRFLDARAWELPYSGAIAAGWLVCAIMAEVLKHRPHVWIEAGFGSGKSGINSDMNTLLGSSVITLSGEDCSAAGLRQHLNSSALPVLYDEATDDDDTGRLDRFIKLQRISYDGGTVPKGTAGHKGVLFRLKSCFMSFSIQSPIKRPEDKSRYAILRLKKLPNSEALQEMLRLQVELREAFQSRDTASRLLTRVLMNAESTLENISQLRRYFTQHGMGERKADTLSALLGAEHLLHSTGSMSEQSMNRAMLIAQAFDNEDLDLQEAEKCLEHMLDAIHPTQRQSSVGQLLRASYPSDSDLELVGMQIWKGETLRIKLSHDGFKGIFQGSRWSQNHKVVLTKLEGVTRSNQRYRGGSPTPCLEIPLSLCQRRDSD